MAIRIPNNLYSEGQVPINSNAFTQFYLQSQQRKRAKAEALDNYFNNWTKSVNPAGMRTQDIENGWSQKVRDWQDFYYQNRDNIQNPLKDNARTRNEFMARYQDILNDTEKSKGLAQNMGKVASVLTDPNKRTRLPDSVIESIHSQDLPMYDPNHKQFDISELDFDAKPFGLKEQTALTSYLTKGLKMGSEVLNITKDPKTKSETVTTEFKYNPEALKAVGDRAAYTYKSDPSFQAFIDDESENPQAFSAMNDVFKRVYNRDIVSHDDFASAYALNTIQKQRQEEKVRGYNPYPPSYIMYPPNANGMANFNYGVSMTNALRTNNTEAVSQLKNLLSSGSSRIKYRDMFVENSSGVPMLVIQTQEQDPSGFYYDPVTTKVAVDDPALPNKLTEVYQNIMGADAKQEKLQYPIQQQQVVQSRTTQPSTQKQQPKPQQPSKKAIKKSDIATKAAAAGYSEDEYKKLLQQNGVQIVD